MSETGHTNFVVPPKGDAVFDLIKSRLCCIMERYYVLQSTVYSAILIHTEVRITHVQPDCGLY